MISDLLHVVRDLTCFEDGAYKPIAVFPNSEQPNPRTAHQLARALASQCRPAAVCTGRIVPCRIPIPKLPLAITMIAGELVDNFVTTEFEAFEKEV